MAKLILKQQEPPKGSWLHHHGSQVAYAGFIALLLLISLGILFAFRPSPVALQSQPLPSISSATNPKVKAQYLSDWEKLTIMQNTYEQLAKSAGSREQAQVLLNQAEMAWQHLLIMTESTEQLGLSAQEKEQLVEEQAYQQDQWQARIHFAELRLEHFSEIAKIDPPITNDAQQPVSSTQAAVALPPSADELKTQAVADTLPSSKFIAQPPAGVKLPAGFCTLDGSGVCKPEASN